MEHRVLITGGAGFIGSHVADALPAKGQCVVALDTLDPRVHGPGRNRPEYLDPKVPMADVLGRRHLLPEVTGKVRVGDVRRCFADMSAASDVPVVERDAGLRELAGWLEGRVAADRGPEARAELAARGSFV